MQTLFCQLGGPQITDLGWKIPPHNYEQCGLEETIYPHEPQFPHLRKL